jgi:uncharacterized protein YjbI with pentapeptide repeats
MMAATSRDDQSSSPSNKTCAFKEQDSGSCPGRKADGFDRCLAHLEPAQLEQVLEHLGPGAELDASRTSIDDRLLTQILRAVRDNAGRPVFGRASFAGAHIAIANFADVQFTGHANFRSAQFTEGADFTSTQFTLAAIFDRAEFTGHADFTNAQFASKASFRNIQFTGHANFRSAQFTEGADFESTQFPRGASFEEAQFTGSASFLGAQFTGVLFGHAQFTKRAFFARAQFTDCTIAGIEFNDTASFRFAQFPEQARLGPLTAHRLELDYAVFERQLVIEAAAASVSCRSTTWKAGVTLRLRYAEVDLERAALTQPSSVTGSDEPFRARTSIPGACSTSTRGLCSRSCPSLRTRARGYPWGENPQGERR